MSEEDLINEMKCLKIDVREFEISQFKKFIDMLLYWNTKMNLTAITKENEVWQKHIIDSLTCIKYIKDEDTIIDIGTGAGFPGIPIKILKPNTRVTLLDSLNKRINFLENVKKDLELQNLECIHGRAEDYARNKMYREQFDIACARAVARLNILCEYCLPYLKVGGKFICMKGQSNKEEIEEAQKAIKILGGNIKDIDELELPGSLDKRTIIIIEKIKNTPRDYPRKPGTPEKKPIV